MTRTIGLGFAPGGLAAGEGAVWVSDPGDGALHRVNAVTGELERRLELGAGGAGPIPVGVGQGSVWAANSNAFRIFRIDPELARIVDRFELDAPRAIHVGDDVVWVLEGSHSLAELDPRTGRIVRVPVDFTPGGLTVGAGAVWATDPDEDVLWRFDARTRSAERTISVGQAPTGVAFGHDAVWVANSFDGTVSKVDPSEDQVVATVQVGERVTAVAAGSGAVWVAVTAP